MGVFCVQPYKSGSLASKNSHKYNMVKLTLVEAELLHKVKLQRRTIRRLKQELAAVRAHNSERLHVLSSLSFNYHRSLSRLWRGIIDVIPLRLLAGLYAMLDEAVRLEDRLLELNSGL